MNTIHWNNQPYEIRTVWWLSAGSQGDCKIYRASQNIIRPAEKMVFFFAIANSQLATYLSCIVFVHWFVNCFRSSARSAVLKFWPWSAITLPNSSQDRALHCLDRCDENTVLTVFKYCFRWNRHLDAVGAIWFSPWKGKIKYLCEQNKSFCIQLCVK